MDISVFSNLLRSELIKNDIPKEQADRYIQTICNSLSPEDISDTTEVDIVRLAKLCKSQIQKDKAANDIIGADTDDAADDADDEEIIISNVIVEDAEDDTDSTEDIQFSQADRKTEPPSVHVGAVAAAKPDSNRAQSQSKPKRTSMFVLITAVSSPLWLASAVIAAAPFIIMFMLEIALVASLVCLIAAFAALGTAASLTGIVYGIVKMFSVPAVGLYEIGFGIIIAGVTMICGILLYNGIVRFMPWLFKKSGLFVKFVFSKIKPLLSEYKRRCESL